MINKVNRLIHCHVFVGDSKL
ncbi:hypothetical protein D041_0592A, partial [Vibrio parahaemolyticus EKP-008]